MSRGLAVLQSANTYSVDPGCIFFNSGVLKSINHLVPSAAHADKDRDILLSVD